MNHRFEHRLAFGILLVLLSASLPGQQPPAGQADPAQTAPGAAAPAMNKAHDDSFVIGNDDVLAINVWKEETLSRSIPVRSDGKISMPLVGEIQATGRTPLQLEQEIAERLKNFITAPEVTVIVQEIKSRNFNILGMVEKPGSYSLSTASTVVDAIATAGGFKDFAKEKGIYILRQGQSGSQTRIPFNYKDFIKGKNPEQNVKLEPHDTIVVP